MTHCCCRRRGRSIFAPSPAWFKAFDLAAQAFDRYLARRERRRRRR